METTKINTVDYELEGRVYRLSCNMNVLADVQDEYDGNLLRALNTVHGLKSTLAFLAAMLTDAADTQGITDKTAFRCALPASSWAGSSPCTRRSRPGRGSIR